MYILKHEFNTFLTFGLSKVIDEKNMKIYKLHMVVVFHVHNTYASLKLMMQHVVVQACLFTTLVWILV